MEKIGFYKHDPLLDLIRTEQEIIELFGEDEFKDSPHEYIEVDDEFITRYQKLMKEFWDMQKEIEELIKRKS